MANLVKDFELPEDADIDALKLDYLMKKHYSALREWADAIIMRNSSDFDAAKIDAYEPQQFLDMLS